MWPIMKGIHAVRNGAIPDIACSCCRTVASGAWVRTKREVYGSPRIGDSRACARKMW